MGMKTLIASHRGGALEWPENSPTSFANTAKLPVDQVEFDIHPTADGEIVVFHDATLDRTSNGTGPVCECTLAELKALSLNGTNSEAMLTLAELCAVFAPTAITLRMEIKPDTQRRPYPDLLARALTVIDGFDLRSRTVVTSFLAETVAEAAAAPGLAGAIWLVSPDVQDYIGLTGIAAVARMAGAGTLGIRAARLDAAVLATLRGHGFGVGAWAVNDEATVRKVLGLGVDVFTTDIPTMALALRG
jgi:glycerophosphoryl diester phosphodiesterase